jgi:hypothetical protein
MFLPRLGGYTLPSSWASLDPEQSAGPQQTKGAADMNSQSDTALRQDPPTQGHLGLTAEASDISGAGVETSVGVA